MTIVMLLPLIVLAICFIIRIPISIGMFSAGVVYFLAAGVRLQVVAEQVTSSLYTNTILLTIPLFIFTANVMDSGKVTQYLFTFCKSLIGKKRGAMAYINILVSLIFSGMTGSAVSDASGIGVIELKEMERDGYDKGFSAAITAASATVGPIFPPSIPMVIYAMIAGVSVGKLFMGGMIPAFLICLALGIYVYFISKKRNYPAGIKFTFRQFVNYTLKALPALFTPIILLFGIYTGIVTPTEAGALAALYALIISFFAYRSLTIKSFLQVVKNTVLQSGIVFALIIGAYVMTSAVVRSGLGEVVSGLFLTLTTNKYVFLLIVNVLFLFLGMLFDTMVLQLIFLPMFLPLAAALGIDLVHFGVVICLNMMIGLSTPPYGLLCYITSGLSKAPLKDVFREVMPMVLIMVAVLLLITYVPFFITFLPNNFM